MNDEADNIEPLAPGLTTHTEPLPQVVDSRISMEVVQGYIEQERRRVRKVLLMITGILLVLILLIFAVFLSVGIYVMNDARDAKRTIRSFRDSTVKRLAVYEMEVDDVNSRIGSLEETGSKLTNMRQADKSEQRIRERSLQTDLKRFGKWVSSQDKGLKQELVKSAERQVRLEVQLADLAARYTQLQAKVQAGPSRPAQPQPIRDVLDAPSSLQDINHYQALFKPPVEREPERTRDPDPMVNVPAAVDPPPTATRTVLRFPNGDTFEGEVRNGLFHGRGTLTYAKGEFAKYEGDFRADMKDGSGVLTFRTGSRYEGEFREDQIEGEGVFNYRNGDKFEGEFARGAKSGAGVYSYANGNRYAGDFNNDVMDGTGVLNFANGDTYSGDFDGGLREGTGTYIYASGGQYSGAFRAGRRHGKGRYAYPSGGIFEGMFVDGKKAGAGIYIYSDGTRLSGTWKNDVFAGQKQ